jgi:hypothetical protein
MSGIFTVFVVLALFILVVGGLAVAVSRALDGKGRPGKADPSLPYRLRDSLLTRAEAAFFASLDRAVSHNDAIPPSRVFAQVRLADILQVPRNNAEYQSHFNRIQSKHVDFLLCCRRTHRPLLAIELDDASHKQQRRRERDGFLDAAMAAAGLPLLRVPAVGTYRPDETAHLIARALSGPHVSAPLSE